MRSCARARTRSIYIRCHYGAEVWCIEYITPPPQKFVIKWKIEMIERRSAHWGNSSANEIIRLVCGFCCALWLYVSESLYLIFFFFFLSSDWHFFHIMRERGNKKSRQIYFCLSIWSRLFAYTKQFQYKTNETIASRKIAGPRIEMLKSTKPQRIWHTKQQQLAGRSF